MKTRLPVFRSASLLLIGLLLAPAAGTAASRRRTQTVTIPFPRGGEAAVGLTNGPLLIRSVRLANPPDVGEVRGPRRDRRDTTLLRWVFHIANAGRRRDWRARIRVTVLDAHGRTLARNRRHGEVDAYDFHDRITIFTRIRNLAYTRADRMRIRADFYPE